MKQILHTYLKRLTNLTGKNRSLLLLRLPLGQFNDLHDFDFMEKRSSFEIINDLIGGKKEIKLGPVADSRDSHVNELSLRLKKIQRMDHYVFEERGSKDLYIGWPFVRGKFSDGTLVRAPLLFFPVELVLRENTWILRQRKDVNVTFNKSFLLAYSYFNKISLPDDFIEQVFMEREADSKAFRTGLYNLLKDSPVEIHFNQENFIDTLHKFEEYKKPDYEKKQSAGELKLFPEAVLGMFPQAGSYLVPDYLHLMEENRYDDIEEFFLKRSREEDIDQQKHSTEYFQFLKKVREDETYTPYKLDSYQENAIKAVKRGNSLVVQGPPGTGKSQLICNMIADHVARGRNVLLVCQKRAALDVVHARLKSQRLSDFTAVVHDFKNDRKSIYKQIEKQIEGLNNFRQLNNGLDTIQMERQFQQSSHKVDQIAEEFEEFRSALFDEEETGISIKELYLTSDRKREVVSLNQEYRHFTFDKVHEFIDKLKIYFEYHKLFKKTDYVWYNRKSFAGYGISDLQKIRRILEEIPKFEKSLLEKTGKLLGAEMGFRAGEKIYEQKDKLFKLLNLVQDEHVYRYFSHMIAKKDVLSESFPDVLWLSTQEKPLISCFESPGPEITIDTAELGNYQRLLKRRMGATKNIYKYLKWLLSTKEKTMLDNVLNKNDLLQTKQKYRILEQKIDLRLNLEHYMTRMADTQWLEDVPENYGSKTFELWFQIQKSAIEAFNIVNSFRNFREYFNVSGFNQAEFTKRLSGMLEILEEVPLKALQWKYYLTDFRIDLVLHDTRMVKVLSEALDRDFDALCDFDQIKEDLHETERQVVEKLIDSTLSEVYEDATELFLNSLRLAWIEHIESKYPILRSVNSLRYETMQKELQEAVKEKLRVSGEITLQRARERTYTDVEFNRLNNLVTYRDLMHQVSKRRMIWPLRKLINAYHNEIFNLIPCWMASPESVSAIFPMEQMFDLVIFDEASQCFSEQGIPAMYRGKQVVVAGDDKQLSPFDLYNVRWDDEKEPDEPALELDSLLDLASRYLMTVQLHGHYRSKTLDLIDFSNRFFYEGRLKLLPDRDLVNRGVPAIKYIKTEGVWSKNINHGEALYIAGLVQKLFHEQPDKDIGIVTFNARQQDYVMDILEEKAMEHDFNIPDHLFVKNIENVQGDERDIIIFSIGYAPDKRGKMKHHFGSLNMRGGENRLNVAVTRAREQIYVVSSILPHQLKVEASKNEGSKLLKSYLEYAWNVSNGNFKPIISGKKGHQVNWYLKNKLQEFQKDPELDIELVEEMPFADLTVKDRDKYLGLILTDDDLYYQSMSIKDMHIYKPLTLSGKNWRFRGIYSREYWHDKDLVKERLKRFVQLIREK